MCVAPFAWSGAGDYPSRPRGGAARHIFGGEDHAEVLRVQRPRLALGERRRRVRGDADAGVAEAGVEDVGAVLGRGHPGAHDRLRGGEPEGAPGDVLADVVTDLRVVDVAARAHPVDRGASARCDVREVILAGHVFAVALRGAFESRIGRERALAVARAFPIDQAEDRGADLFEVARPRREVHVHARACRGGFRRGRFRGKGWGRRGRPGGEGDTARKRRPCPAGRPACGGRVGLRAEGRRREQPCRTSACHGPFIGRSVSEPERGVAGSAGYRAGGRAGGTQILPRISRMISSEPPPIGPRRASRAARSIPYSSM